MATQVQPQKVEDISVDFADIKQSKKTISDDHPPGKSKKSNKESRDPSPEKPKSGSDLKRKPQQRATKSDPKNENPKPTKKSRDPSPPKKTPKETSEGILSHSS